MSTDPAQLRRGYRRGALDVGDVADTWSQQMRRWFDEAVDDPAILEPNAVQLATVDAGGRPEVRTVLAKGIDDRGVVFYTNYDSAKGRALTANPYASLVFVWLPHERSVRFAGPVSRVDRAETEAYFATRPRESQLGAWASPQSQVVESRAALEAMEAEVERRFEGQDVPAPPNWGGYRLAPDSVEFWQGRQGRLHDRIRFRADGTDSAGSTDSTDSTDWIVERLAP